MYRSEQTNQQVLPQPAALESTTADTPRVGTKRVVELRPRVETAVQHGRGEMRESARHSEGENPRKIASGDACVFVLDRRGKPLQPTSPARARELLKKGRARVHRHTPFVIRLVDRSVEQSEVDGVTVGVDPGSKNTGLAVFLEDGLDRVGLHAVEIQHRGALVKKKIQQRSGYRRRRRSKNLRYRAPRYNNRTKPKGWLPPSLQHRVDTTVSWVDRLSRWSPVRAIRMEWVQFDTHLLTTPGISGAQYQNGTLAGTEVREYLLVKWKHACAYCGNTGVPLNIDHVLPRAKGGTDRISNLVLACVPCNQAKKDLLVEVFLADRPNVLQRINAQRKIPLKDAAATQSVRNATLRALAHIADAADVDISTSTGGRTKWNRTRNNLPKDHSTDALCVGVFEAVIRVPRTVTVAKSMGRGSYSRTRTDRFGFPRNRLPRVKRMFGVSTGDLVRANVPQGKYAGVHTGRVAVRSSGSFTVAGATVSHKYVTVLQCSDGYDYSRKGLLLLPAVNDRVSAAGRL